MPIKNKPGFVPKSFKYQPDHYIKIFRNICAVFTHPTRHVTLYIEVDADVRNHEHFMDASGDPIVGYQGETCRIRLCRHETLRAALEHMEKILSNPEWGETLKEKPVFRKHDCWYPNKNLREKPKTYRRKGNGKKFFLTEEDKKELLSYGFYTEKDLPQIEEAANRSTYIVRDKDGNDLRIVNVWETIEALGRKTFLSGIGRSAFHFTSSRENPATGVEIYFDSSVLFR